MKSQRKPTGLSRWWRLDISTSEEFLSINSPLRRLCEWHDDNEDNNCHNLNHHHQSTSLHSLDAPITPIIPVNLAIPVNPMNFVTRSCSPAQLSTAHCFTVQPNYFPLLTSRTFREQFVLVILIIQSDMSHSQMLGKFEYTLPAKFWRLVGCTEMLSW